MSKELAFRRILEEPDFVKCVKYNNSLSKYLASDEAIGIVQNVTIAKLLMLTEEEVENIYKESVDFIKKGMLESDEEV